MRNSEAEIQEIVPISEVIQAEKGYFFSPGALRAFRSTYSDVAWRYAGGFLFWTSEKSPSAGSKRLYSVRFMSEQGRVCTMGKFQEFSSARAAELRIALLLAGGEI
jgi:hypothetical protein